MRHRRSKGKLATCPSLTGKIQEGVGAKGDNQCELQITMRAHLTPISCLVSNKVTLDVVTQ